jgi:hypothetical protein
VPTATFFFKENKWATRIKPVSSSELEAETERTVGGEANSSRYFFS